MDNATKKRRMRVAAVLGMVAAAGSVALYFVLKPPDPRELRLDEYLDHARAGDVRTATIGGGDRVVTGELNDGSRYRVGFPVQFGDELTTTLRDSSPPIELSAKPPGSHFWSDLASMLIPLALLAGAFIFVMARYQGGGKAMAFGRAKARRSSGRGVKVTFAEVAGAEEAVEELAEIVAFLRHPERFRAMGARIPKGVLLYGPPGTGKTLLARAVAGEADAAFFSISGSDFVEMFVGVGAARVRDLFQQALEASPAIVFVDEIDAVGRQRGAGVGGGHDEREQTLNQLLVEMDGFDGRAGVIVLAATNRPDILDPALLRPGRFDRHVAVELPDLAGREAILGVHAVGKPLSTAVDLAILARRTPGLSGADLANLLNEGALLAARRGRQEIGPLEIEEAVERVLTGSTRRTRVISQRERLVIAYHEAGHAIVGHAMPTGDTVHKVSIVARGKALGWTMSLPRTERALHTRAELIERMAMLLGGRTAEELVFGEVTTGAADDIERATDLARLMVTEYGMSDSLGPRRMGPRAAEPFVGRSMSASSDYAAALADRIDAEIDLLVNDARTTARAVLTAWRAVLERLAQELLIRESVDELELAAIFEGRALPPLIVPDTALNSASAVSRTTKPVPLGRAAPIAS